MLTLLRTKILSSLVASLALLILAGCGQGAKLTADQAENVSDQTRQAMLATASPSVSWVYYNGDYVWDYIKTQKGDWDSNLNSNYTSTAIKCLTGSQCLQLVPTTEWGIWIPYPQNPNNPNPNDTVNHPGIGINIANYSYLTIAIYPTQAGFTPTLGIDYAVPGKVDQSGGRCVGLATSTNGYGGNNCATGNFGPATMIPNQWNVYNIPISAFNIGSILAETNGWIYKFLLQEQGNNAGSNQQTFYVDQVGFSTAPIGAGTVTPTPTPTPTAAPVPTPVPTATPPSIASASGTMIPPATQIIDNSKNVWTVTSGVIYENGKTAGYSANVKLLLYQNGVIYQENASNLWWSWNGTTWVSVSNPLSTPAPTPTATPPSIASASGTMIPPATQIIDNSKNVWTVTSGVIYENGKTAGYSANVKLLLYQNGVIYQENASNLWWSWNGTTWVSVSNPLSTPAPTPTATPKSTATPAPTAKPTATPSAGTGGCSGGAVVWAYNNGIVQGQYTSWGDFDNNASTKYNDTTGHFPGGGTDALTTETPGTPWGEWLYHAPQYDANDTSTSTTPQYGVNITGCNFLNLAMNPGPTQLSQMSIGAIRDFPADTPATGNGAYFGSITGTALGNNWVQYKIALYPTINGKSYPNYFFSGPSETALPNGTSTFYKFGIQDHSGSSSNYWYNANVYFSAE